MSYSSYERDKLEVADQMRIDRNIYFEESKSDISGLTALPLGELSAMREKSAAAERAIFERLQEQAAAWEEQAGNTLLIDKAIEYARTREAAHTSNKWEQTSENRHERSNRVYKMYYYPYENTRYDSKAGKSVPYSYTLTWGIYTNGPGGYGGAKIAGQSRKVFATKAEMEKYLNGRIKAYNHLFTEISPPIPKEYAEHFKVNGQLLPGYTIEGEQPPQQVKPQQEPKPVVDALPPEQRQELSATAAATLQTLIDADIAAHGEVIAGTLDAIQAQGFSYRDGRLEKAGPQEPEQAGAAAPEQEEKRAGAQPEPRPVTPIVLTSEKPADKLKEITDRLEQGITELFDSERYKEYLRVMSRFHNYSFNNTLLIALQKPDASLIAGFSAWKNNFGRSVMKGEKGIKILAPSPFKVKKQVQKIDPDTRQPMTGKDGRPITEEKEITVPAFKVVSVFDVSQTEGRELPSIGVDELTGDVDRFQDFFTALEQTSPAPIGFEKIAGGAHGYYHLEEKRIAIDEGMSELQTLKTAIHEVAHAKLHAIDPDAPKEEQNRADRRTREVEAESVAYTVCQHYGLDTSDYSFGYVAGWSSGRELAELKGSLETIRNTAAEMINAIDGYLAALQKTREKEQAAGQDKPQEQAGPEYIYQVHANPRSDSRENLCFLQAYLPQQDGAAKIGDVLYVGTPEKCRELMERLHAGELTQEQVKELYAKAQEQPARDGDSFTIYQIKRGDETRDYRYMAYDELKAAGLVVDRANYAEAYTAPLTPGMSLEDIYTRFNTDHPADFKGHSLSVSDVVVLRQDGRDAAYYVDSIGFRQAPEFTDPALTPDSRETGEQIRTPRGSFYVTAMSREQMEAAGYGFHHQSEDGKYLIMGNGTRAFAIPAQPENYLKTAEQSAEQNYNMIDGQINNTPTAAEIEARARAGKQISLTDYAKALKAEQAQGGGAPKEKPSIRAQLAAAKEQAAARKKTAAKTKNHEMEV